MNLLNKAEQIEQEIISFRRHIHQNPEVGFDLDKTRTFVKECLISMGCNPSEMGGGIVVDIGKGEPVFLLRADMDALPMEEKSNLSFSSVNPNIAHTCGHDIHTSILLGAAKILKGMESELKGTVRLMFQPDEEGGRGCKSMIDAGVLKNPPVSAALAMHTAAQQPTGNLFYTIGSSMASSDIFTIDIQGKGGHGAGPQYSIDPINIGCHIQISLQELIARESPPSELTVLTIGSFHSGDAPNIIPDKAQLKGTLRTHNAQTRTKLKNRIEEITSLTAQCFGGTATCTYTSSIPVLFSDESLVKGIIGSINEMLPEVHTEFLSFKGGGSEDFAEICQEIPSAYMSIGTGLEKDGFVSGQHNPYVIFDEACIKNGISIMVCAATSWLNKNS